MTESSRYKIRLRHRRGYVKEAGRYLQWSEYQVTNGRKVIGRFDLETQAREFIREKEESDK